MPGLPRRLTQRDIARMTGVSQATVSLVLNGRADGDVRIAQETRDRVLRAIRDSGYVADPIARRLAARDNRIIGVFTYEPVFPTYNSDFYHPFLVGIEEQAEALGSDLLLLTSAPVIDGRRRIFHEGNRLRLADGCVLLGRSLDRDELARLVAEGYPFVSVGRRDDAAGTGGTGGTAGTAGIRGIVPYVGADYATATAALVERAVRLGHTALTYLGQGEGPESHADRMAGFRRVAPRGAHATTPELIPAGTTVVFAEEHSDGVALLAQRPELSVVTLGEPTRQGPQTTREFAGFQIPRQQMGREAMEVLNALLEGAPTTLQRLLPCALVEGTTLNKNG